MGKTFSADHRQGWEAIYNIQQKYATNNGCSPRIKSACIFNGRADWAPSSSASSTEHFTLTHAYCSQNAGATAVARQQPRPTGQNAKLGGVVQTAPCCAYHK